EALRQKVQKRLDHDLRAIELVLEQVDSNADPLSSDGLADIDFSARPVAALASKEEEEGQHATFKLTRCVQLVGQEQPWRTFPHAVQQINPIPSFICEDESRFLAWYCASEYSGQGAIVDMGPLGGGSTHSMAFGL